MGKGKNTRQLTLNAEPRTPLTQTDRMLSSWIILRSIEVLDHLYLMIYQVWFNQECLSGG